MTSTSVTTVGGVVVVTQVIAKDETGVQLQSTSDQQAPPTAQQAPPTGPAPKMDNVTAIFLRGAPGGLGLVQICIGLLCVLFSATAAFSPVLALHAPLGLAVTFVASGSLAVAAASGRTLVSRLWACLASNLTGVLLGLGGVAYLCWLLARSPASKRLCDSGTSSGFVLSDELKMRCSAEVLSMDVLVYGLQGLLLVLLVLQVCVAATVCVFSVRALGRRHKDHEPVEELGSDVALLDSE